MNLFESGARKVIPAVLVYLRKGDEILMLFRGRPGDFHHGKWNGLGGKCEGNESPLEAALREIREEAGIGLESEQFNPVGVIQFPLFKPHRNEDWLVFIFTVEVRESQLSGLKAVSEEGSLHWIKSDDLLSLNLWEGDRHFIPWVLEEKSFLGTFWYREQKLDRYWLVPFSSPAP